jgi:hypothetical protein
MVPFQLKLKPMEPKMITLLRSLFTHQSRLSAEQELKRSIHLAFRLATQTGRLVSLALQPGPRCLVPRLGALAAVGMPEGTPPPPGMLDPRWASHPRPLMVSPWHTATEGMWFIQDEIGALCMHLTAKGGLRFLRFRADSGCWVEA